MSTTSLIKLISYIFFGVLALFLTIAAFFSSAEVSTSSRPPNQWHLTKLDIIGMLKAGKYADLTKKYTDLHKKFSEGKASWGDISRAVQDFDYADPGLRDRFSEWVSKFPNSFVPYVARGFYLSNMGFEYRGTDFASNVHPRQMALMVEFFRKAMPDLKKAIKLNPKAVSAYERMMSLQMFTGDDWGVWQTYLIGYFKVPDATPLTSAMSRALEPKWGGGALTRTIFQDFALIAGFFDPGFRVVLHHDTYTAADMATYSRQYRKALALWTDLMATDKSAYVRYRRAYVLSALGRRDEALRDALIAIQKAPEYIAALSLAASIYADSGSREKAVQYYSAALKLAPYKPRLLIHRAYALARLKRFDEAIQDLDNALVFGNWTKNIHYNRARLLRSPLKRTAAAKKAYIRYFRFGSKNLGEWREFTMFLQFSEDCDYFVYIKKLLDICLRDQSCGREQVEAHTSLARAPGWPSRCKNIPNYSGYMAWFPAATNLDEATVAGLKPGQGPKEILARFPDALITPIKIGEEKKLVAYQVKRGSLQNPPRVIMYTDTDQRIFRIAYMENVAGESGILDLEKKYTSLYGPPDSRRLYQGVRLEYRQPGRKGKFAKILQIALQPLKREKQTAGTGKKQRIQVRISLEDLELREATSARAEGARQNNNAAGNAAPGETKLRRAN